MTRTRDSSYEEKSICVSENWKRSSNSKQSSLWYKKHWLTCLNLIVRYADVLILTKLWWYCYYYPFIFDNNNLTKWIWLGKTHEHSGYSNLKVNLKINKFVSARIESVVAIVSKAHYDIRSIYWLAWTWLWETLMYWYWLSSGDLVDFVIIIHSDMIII